MGLFDNFNPAFLGTPEGLTALSLFDAASTPREVGSQSPIGVGIQTYHQAMKDKMEQEYRKQQMEMQRGQFDITKQERSLRLGEMAKVAQRKQDFETNILPKLPPQLQMQYKITGDISGLFKDHIVPEGGSVYNAGMGMLGDTGQQPAASPGMPPQQSPDMGQSPAAMTPQLPAEQQNPPGVLFKGNPKPQAPHNGYIVSDGKGGWKIDPSLLAAEMKLKTAGTELTANTMRRGQDMVDAREREKIAQGGKPPSGYRITASGDLEAIPGGPADIKAQALQGLKAAGASDVDQAIATLRDAYDRLDAGGGITNTEKSPAENMGAWGSASAGGQFVGKMFGTANQSARNDVAMTRPALLAALMKATGMSAKQMDSNAELKLWLATATDPQLDVGSNRRALDNIERKYLASGVKAAANTKQSTQQTAPQTFDIQAAAAAELARRRGGR